MTKTRALVPAPLPPGALEILRQIPEERLWVESQHSAATRRAYRSDVAGFIAFLGLRSVGELRKVDRAAVVAWRRSLQEAGAKPSTIHRKISALSSLFTHLVEQQLIRTNPCRDIRRPPKNQRQGTTPAFSPAQARAILDAPAAGTIQGLRDRAILSVGFQAGARRASITRLRVKHLYPDAGFECLRFHWKGGHEHTVALHPQTAQRIREYLTLAGHGEDLDGPLFRPVRANGRSAAPRRFLDPEAVDRVLKRYARAAKVKGRFSAHSMRATFITTALDNGASLERVQEAAGHANPATTKLYDRRGFKPAESAAFFANY
jgi:integrase/recombinase XerD